MPYILQEQKDSVAVITLNRPEQLNALRYDMLDEMLAALNSLSLDTETRVIVLKGAGRAFCAGDDLKSMGNPAGRTDLDWLTRARYGYRKIVRALLALHKPVIASIRGYALGAGFELALASDFRICAENTKMGPIFIKRALVAGTYLLPRFVGLAKATEMLFLGEPINAQEALQLHLVNRVVASDKLDEATAELSNCLAQAPTRAIGYAKMALHGGLDMGLEQGLDYDSFATHLSLETEDREEGLRAFLEKREPRYTGR